MLYPTGKVRAFVKPRKFRGCNPRYFQDFTKDLHVYCCWMSLPFPSLSAIEADLETVSENLVDEFKVRETVTHREAHTCENPLSLSCSSVLNGSDDS